MRDTTSWNALSANAVLSLGYKYSFSSFTLASRIDTLYSFTDGTSYIAEDKTIIEIKDENRLYLLPSIILTYVNAINLNPFISLGIILPLHTVGNDTVLINGYDVLYREDETLAHLDLGIQYRYEKKTFSILVYATTGIEIPVYEQKILDISCDIGLAIVF